MCLAPKYVVFSLGVLVASFYSRTMYSPGEMVTFQIIITESEKNCKDGKHENLNFFDPAQ